MRGGPRAPAAVLGLIMLPLAPSVQAAERPGVLPETPWACPATHPIKGYVTEESGPVYYMPETRFYEEASPERCYASEAEARRDGGRPADIGRRGPAEKQY